MIVIFQRFYNKNKIIFFTALDYTNNELKKIEK